MKGFTYIEVILYTAIVFLMMTTLIPFAWNIVGGGAKSATEQEVFSNARYIAQRLQREIRNATGIATMSASLLSLDTILPSTNPTTISLANGNLSIQQGAGGAVVLNSQNASISALTFTSYTSTNSATKHIQFVFTVVSRFAGAGQRQEYADSTTIESSAEIRSN